MVHLFQGLVSPELPQPEALISAPVGVIDQSLAPPGFLDGRPVGTGIQMQFLQAVALETELLQTVKKDGLARRRDEFPSAQFPCFCSGYHFAMPALLLRPQILKSVDMFMLDQVARRFQKWADRLDHEPPAQIGDQHDRYNGQRDPQNRRHQGHLRSWVSS